MPETVPLPRESEGGFYALTSEFFCCVDAMHALGVRSGPLGRSTDPDATPRQLRIVSGAAKTMCGYELTDADDLRAEIDELVAKVREVE